MTNQYTSSTWIAWIWKLLTTIEKYEISNCTAEWRMMKRASQLQIIWEPISKISTITSQIILHNLTTRDAILFSRSWQAIAVSVCRKLVNIDSVVSELCARHSKHTQRRRNNAITNALRQDYLQTDDEITTLRKRTNDWLA